MRFLKLVLLIVFVLLNKPSLGSGFSAQNSDTLKTKNIFLTIGSGYPEFANVGAGWHVNSKISLIFGAGIRMTSHSGFFGYGGFWGLTGKYFFDRNFFAFNNIGLNINYDGYGERYAFELQAGYEFLLKKLITFYWAGTFSAVVWKGNTPYFSLGLRLGMNINLF